MILQVDTVAGLFGEPEPSAFTLGTQRIGVITIIDRWLSQEQGYFKVKADDGAIYILRHDEQTGQWELTLFQAGAE